MYKLGFCVYGPRCRFRHTRVPGPPPPPETFEAAKPRDFRNINLIVNSSGGSGANPGRVGFGPGDRWLSKMTKNPSLLIFRSMSGID